MKLKNNLPKEVWFFILGVITFIHMMFTEEKDPHTHYEGKKK